MTTGKKQQIPRQELRGRPAGGVSLPRTLGASTRLPEPVVLAIREEARIRGLSPSRVLAEAVGQGRPDWPWPEKVGRPVPTTGP